MSKKNTFSTNSLVNHTRKTLSIPSFVGSDLTSPQTQVNERRAIYSNNYMKRDGYVQKRFAYEQVARPKSAVFYDKGFDGTLGTETITNPTNINGMWNFMAEDGKRHVIAHIGHLLYEIKNLGHDASFKLLDSTVSAEGRIYSHKYENRKTFGTIGQNKLWLLGGGKYIVIRFMKDNNGVGTVEPVADSSVSFVPTTTIGITYKDALAGKRSGLDYPNLMSKFRKNMLLTGTGKGTTATTKWYEYTLDAPIATNSETADKDMKEMSETISIRGEVIENG